MFDICKRNFDSLSYVFKMIILLLRPIRLNLRFMGWVFIFLFQILYSVLAFWLECVVTFPPIPRNFNLRILPVNCIAPINNKSLEDFGLGFFNVLPIFIKTQSV